MKSRSVQSVSAMGTIEFMGLSVQPKSMQEMNQLVEQGIREGRKWIIANHNLHSVYLFHRYHKLREFYSRVHWTYLDGMSLVALGRLYGYPLQRDQRVTNADWTGPLMELAAARGWRVFNLGSPKPVAAEAARELYPSLQLEMSDGYFDATRGSTENEALIERINAFRPDLLLVAMGMPRQEFWTLENFARLDVHVVLSSNGAAFDYLAGAARTPPRWSGRMGLEWLFRLMFEPRRLFSRYLIEPWYVFLVLLIDLPRSRFASKLWGRPEAGYAGSTDQSSPIHGD